MKYTKWIWIFLLAILLIGAALLLLQTKANNTYLLFSPQNASLLPVENISQ